MQESATFGPEFASVASARSFVREVLDAWQFGARIPEASVLVTELCSNSVLHARGAYTVTVSCRDDVLRIAVRDASVHLPVEKTRTPEAMTGRGLVLVDAYADAWGVERHADGKTVWATLAVGVSKVPGHRGRRPLTSTGEAAAGRGQVPTGRSPGR